MVHVASIGEKGATYMLVEKPEQRRTFADSMR
jgi:hypothetical protein